jgi:ubiquitin-conjugating enzyme E2 W
MLRMKFPQGYPAKPPSVYFVKPKIPVHAHVYPNGDICLSVLGSDWRPNMTAESIVLSILSMLTNTKRKCAPVDGGRVENEPGGSQQSWSYHDDRC